MKQKSNGIMYTVRGDLTRNDLHRTHCLNDQPIIRRYDIVGIGVALFRNLCQCEDGL